MRAREHESQPAPSDTPRENVRARSVGRAAFLGLLGGGVATLFSAKWLELPDGEGSHPPSGSG